MGTWGSETFYVVGPALGTAGCLATAWSLPEERQYHPSSRDSQNVPTQPRAPALWEVRVTHRKKVKTTPSSLGQSFPDINTLLSAMSQDTTTLRLLGGGKSAQRLLLEKAGT